MFLQNETEARRENVSKPREIRRFQEGGLKMDVKRRAGQKGRWGGNHTRVRERSGLGNTFSRYVLLQTRGRKLSSLQKQVREVHKRRVGW